MFLILNTKTLSVSFPPMLTLQWPELWNAFPTGLGGTEADGEGYVCVLGRRSIRGGGGGRQHWAGTMTFPIPLHK